MSESGLPGDDQGYIDQEELRRSTGKSDEAYDRYKDTTTHRIFIKLDGKIFTMDLPGPGDPCTPYCHGINLDLKYGQAVVESISHKRAYPSMVEDWLTYYNGVGFELGEATSGIEPMILKSSQSVRCVEADLQKMKEFDDKQSTEYKAAYAAMPRDQHFKLSEKRSAERKAFVSELIVRAKRFDKILGAMERRPEDT